MMLLKIGSKGHDVKLLQKFLKLKADGDFGPKTDKAVRNWQSNYGLAVDGVVGPKTWDAMGLASTDIQENVVLTEQGLQIHRHHLEANQYKAGPVDKDFLFLHHTAGTENPYRTIDFWGRNAAQIATEFVIGGPSVKGNNDKYDGEVVQAFPDGAYAWHLGDNGSHKMHIHSIGIEVCNFGYIKNGETYVGTKAHADQIVTLAKSFRKHKTWHRYSNDQIESLRKLILSIAHRDNIDVRKGLVQQVKKHGAAGFEFNQDAYDGKVKGMWTHTNTRKDKSDMFPQQELLDMLVSL